ncbi:MAG: YbaB/EbfC family nucleoid-associated protein [Deltaproteobacteria bacterium]|nr:YbaB/EbfC family nucleoid-associated protein [Deltaproteobacteria bacterium]
MKGGFGGMPGGMKDLFKQMQKMQEKLAKAQEEAKQVLEEGSSGGGMVTVVANGESQLTSIKIEKEVVDPNDVEMLQDLVMAACNEALKKSKAVIQEKISQVTGGVNIPGIF